MSDETPPWEIPESLLKELAEAPARDQAQVDAIMSAPYVASEHMPVWDYIEDEDERPTFLGCACEIPNVYEPDDWGPHVDELQRRDRARVWKAGATDGSGWAHDDNPYEDL